MLALGISLLAKADPFDDIIAAMKAGNVKQISAQFNNSIELTVPNSEGVYSKQQAEIMLKNFFTQNPPQNVVMQHQGSSAQSAKYVIAVYESEKAKFRAYIFMKDSGAGFKIHELRFEKQ